MTAIILAGGQSRRMGRNKALLRLEPDGPTLIEIVVGAARAVTPQIILSTNTPEVYAWLQLPRVADEFPGAGPLAGLAAGLAVMTTSHALLLGCDMPFLQPPLLRHLAAQALASDVDAVVPLNANGQMEPLCAVYRRSCLASARAQLAAGKHKMMDWLASIATRCITADELRRFDPRLQSLHNLNTPEDLAKGREHEGRADEEETRRIF